MTDKKVGFKFDERSLLIGLNARQEGLRGRNREIVQQEIQVAYEKNRHPKRA